MGLRTILGQASNLDPCTLIGLFMQGVGLQEGESLEDVDHIKTLPSLLWNTLLHLAKLDGARHTDGGSEITQGHDSSSHLASTEDYFAQ